MQRTSAILVILIAAFAVSATSPSSARERLPEVSHDGLHLVKEPGFAAVYLKPGASLRQYDKLVHRRRRRADPRSTYGRSSRDDRPYAFLF
jgi:hypothetical protein